MLLQKQVFCEQQNSIGPPVLKPMPRRAIILIIGFWAFLTIITPTLVLWSKFERERLQHSSGEERVEIKARKMMAYTERLHLTFALPSLPLPPPQLQSSKPPPPPPSHASSPSPSPASSPGSSPPTKDSVTWDTRFESSW